MAKTEGSLIVGDIYPEYYIIKVRKFDDVARNTLDEWIYYLKNNRIEDHFTAQGLDKARELLLIDNLNKAEQARYWRAIDNELLSESAYHTVVLEGSIKGEAIGLEKVVINCHKSGYTIDAISVITGLTAQQITEILKRHGLI